MKIWLTKGKKWNFCSISSESSKSVELLNNLSALIHIRFSSSLRPFHWITRLFSTLSVSMFIIHWIKKNLYELRPNSECSRICELCTMFKEIFDMRMRFWLKVQQQNNNQNRNWSSNYMISRCYISLNILFASVTIQWICASPPVLQKSLKWKSCSVSWFDLLSLNKSESFCFPKKGNFHPWYPCVHLPSTRTAIKDKI